MSQYISFELTTMSTTGYTSLSAIVVLACPRPVEPQKGTRNVVFDGNFYIHERGRMSSLALLRYFIPDDMIHITQKFSEKAFQTAFIVANVCFS